MLEAPSPLVGLAQSMLSIGPLVVSLPIGLLSDITKRRRPLIVLGSALASAGIGLTAFAVNAWMVVLSQLFFGFSNTIFMIGIQSYFADISVSYRSLIFGTYLAASWLGGILSPSIAG